MYGNGMVIVNTEKIGVTEIQVTLRHSPFVCFVIFHFLALFISQDEDLIWVTYIINIITKALVFLFRFVSEVECSDTKQKDG